MSVPRLKPAITLPMLTDISQLATDMALAKRLKSGDLSKAEMARIMARTTHIEHVEPIHRKPQKFQPPQITAIIK